MTLSMRNILFAVATLGLLSLMALPTVTQAQFDPNIKNDAKLAGDTTGSADALADLIVEVTQFLAGLLAVLAVLVIVIAGILYITSGGDEGRIASAKTWLTYAIIGLIVALLAFVIVSTVAGALVG